MRRTLIILSTLFISSFSTAATTAVLKVADLHKKSEALLQESAKAKTEAERVAKLLELKKEINAARDSYKKNQDVKDISAHEAVAFFYYTLVPVFKIVEEKKIPENCDRTQGKIRSAEARGLPEGAPLSKDASIALEWLKIFCK
jgi:TRAP-type uncharacterized transport system substrate-binding protein